MGCKWGYGSGGMGVCVWGVSVGYGRGGYGSVCGV